jgi:hypothetical protein
VLAAGSTGTGLAIMAAEDDRWQDGTLSHLGADAGAGPWFQATLAAAGLLALALAFAMWPVFDRLLAAGRMSVRWRWLHRTGVAVLGPGLLAAMLFPLDVAPAVDLLHGTAVYGISVLLLGTMLTARLAVPSLGDRFGRASLAVLAAILLLYLAAVMGPLSFAAIELVAFPLGGLWLLAWVRALEGRATRGARP